MCAWKASVFRYFDIIIIPAAKKLSLTTEDHYLLYDVFQDDHFCYSFTLVGKYI